MHKKAQPSFLKIIDRFAQNQELQQKRTKATQEAGRFFTSFPWFPSVQEPLRGKAVLEFMSLEKEIKINWLKLNLH